MLRGILGSTAILGACSFGGGPQAMASPDWAAEIHQALTEFKTPNGPVVEMVETVACASDEGTLANMPSGQESQGVRCPGEAAGRVLRRYASQVNATLVTNGGEEPHCPWTRAATAREKGLKLEVSVADVPDERGRIFLRVDAKCVRDPSDPMGRIFFESALFPYQLVDGEWKRTGEVLRIIT